MNCLGKIEVIQEPLLEFGYGQQLSDPRDGLTLFGPYDANAPAHPGILSYGIVGTSQGIELFYKWAQAMIRPWVNAPKDRHRLWPPYPGFQAAFSSEWKVHPVWKHELDGEDLSQLARRHDPYERVHSVVDKYLDVFGNYILK